MHRTLILKSAVQLPDVHTQTTAQASAVPLSTQLTLLVVLLGLFACGYTALALALRRRFGAPGLWVGFVAVVLFLSAVIWTHSSGTVSDRLGQWAAATFFGTSAFLAPTITIQRLSRRSMPPATLRALLYGVASAYLVLAVAAIAFVAAALVHGWTRGNGVA